jgi:hypothetical protein
MPDWKKLVNVAKQLGRTLGPIAKQVGVNLAVQTLQEVVWGYIEPYVAKRKTHSLDAGDGHQHVGRALAAKDRGQYNAALQNAIRTYAPHVSNELTVDNFYASFWTAIAYAHLNDAEQTQRYMLHAYRIGAKVLNDTPKTNDNASARYGIAEVLDALQPYIPRDQQIRA